MRATVEINGQSVDLEWIKTSSGYGYTPITQVYGICFNQAGEILICREDNEHNWQLPGGKPEDGESVTDTLQREVREEVSIEVDNVICLGLQRVHYPHNPNHAEGVDYYQARLIGQVINILPQTVDPATGKLWERRFVPADNITAYIQWGVLGDAMFRDAIDTYVSLA